MACELGNMYNKEEVLRFLIDRDAFGNPAHVSHIRRIKVTDLSWRGGGTWMRCRPYAADVRTSLSHARVHPPRT